MRQLPLAELRLSAALEAADSVVISHQGAAASGAAGHLRAQAARLDALRDRMQTGLWVSPAGAGFAQVAGEHARRLRVVADLFQELASALQLLSAGLQRARADALFAVARGRRLDAAAQELNHRLRVQHPLVSQDPDSRLLSDPEAELISAGMQAAAQELARAERAAGDAWRRAAVDFDRVGYATPVMRQRMQTASWDPAASVSLAAGGSVVAATSCGPMAELALPSNGVITGPDGRAYSLVVQTARGRDGRLLVSTRETPGSGDWQELAVRFGTTAYGRKASTWEKLAVAVGGFAGADYPEGSTFAPELLGELRILPGGGAYLPELEGKPGNPVKEAPAEPPRGQEHARYWTRPAGGVAGGRRAAAPDAVGLLDAGIAGVLLAGRLDDSRAADYRIVFEEDGAGNRRARLQLFRVLVPPDEAPLTVAAGGYVDAGGQLAGIAVTGESPDLHPVMTPGR